MSACAEYSVLSALEQVNHLFDRVAHRSVEPPREPDENHGPEDGESDREPDDLDAILDDTLQAIARMDPQNAQRVTENSAGPLFNPPQGGSSASAVLGGSSVYSQTPGPQGPILAVSTEYGHP